MSIGFELKFGDSELLVFFTRRSLACKPTNAFKLASALKLANSTFAAAYLKLASANFKKTTAAAIAIASVLLK